MNEQQQDRLRELYHRSRHEQPSSELDQAVRLAAQRALSRKRRRWLWGLSTAAVVLLSFSVLLTLTLDQSALHDPVIDFYSPEAPAEIQAPMPRLKKMEREAATPQRVDPAPSANIASSEVATDNALKQLSAPSLEAQRIEIPSYFSLPQDAETTSESPLPSLTVPILPTGLAELTALHDGLSGEAKGANVTLYAGNKLILTINRQDDGFLFKAWRGVEVLEVEVDWTLQPSQVAGCERQSVYIRCTLGQGVDGYFEGSRLDHIVWRQADG